MNGLKQEIIELISNSEGIACVINNQDNTDIDMTYEKLRQLNIIELMKTHTIITEIWRSAKCFITGQVQI